MSKKNKDFQQNYRKEHGDKALKEYNKAQRITVGFNTGTRTMKTEKDYTRKEKHKEDYFSDDYNYEEEEDIINENSYDVFDL
jgi:hypothetical protein